MRSFRHWNAHYLADRVLVSIRERRRPRDPWLTHQANEILDSWLQPTDVGFEWGSGRSTSWFADRVAKLTSVEHNSVWAKKVSEALANRSEGGCVDYRLRTLQGEAASPYVMAIDDVPEETLDFCLVDGGMRDHCALRALPRLKRGALLIVDDGQRYLPRPKPSRTPGARSLESGFPSEQWCSFSKSVQDWRCIWTSNGVKDTAIWAKP